MFIDYLTKDDTRPIRDGSPKIKWKAYFQKVEKFIGYLTKKNLGTAEMGPPGFKIKSKV